MCQWMLELNGEVTPRSTTRPLALSKRHNPKEFMRKHVFIKVIRHRIRISTSAQATIGRRCRNPEHENETYVPYGDDMKERRILPDIEDVTSANHRDVN